MTKQEYLNQIESVIKNGTYKDTWQSRIPGSHCRIIKRRNGITATSLASSFIGAFTPCRLTAASGIQGQCMTGIAANLNITAKPMARRTNSATRILFRCSELKNSALKNGWRFLKKREQNLLCPCVSIMTALQCMTRRLTVGTPKIWDH